MSERNPLFLRDNLPFRKAAEIALSRIGMMFLRDPLTTSQTRNAILTVARDAKGTQRENLAQAVLAEHGPGIAERPEEFAAALADAFQLLALPPPSAPSLGDVLRVLAHLVEERQGTATIAEMLAALQPKPEPGDEVAE